MRLSRATVNTALKATQASYTALQQQIARSPQNALVSSRLSQSSYQSLLNEFQRTEMAHAYVVLRMLILTFKSY